MATNENVPSHALVEWINEANRFSVVAVSQIEEFDMNDYEQHGVYKVRFGMKKYLAKLILIGKDYSTVNNF